MNEMQLQNKILNVMTIVGTRPEIIRLSRTMALLDQHVNHILVHTGQNYDYELNDVFWDELELRKPDYFLQVDTSSLGAAVGDIIRKSEGVLQKEMPDALLVLGDTNSCLAAYMAKRLHIPVFHMEAGNRCFDFDVPEEINRRIIDNIADFNLVYTEHARRHLIAEGLPQRRIFLTGSPMREVLDFYKGKIEKSSILGLLSNDLSSVAPEGIHPGSYFLVSVHREENVDNPVMLQNIVDILNTLAVTYELPVIVSTHPRTRKRLEALNAKNIDERVVFLKPFGFPDYIHLQMHARCVISDSGTISEESAILGFPAISFRKSMERPEAQDAGTIILSGFDPGVVLQAIEVAVAGVHPSIPVSLPAEYKIRDTSWRVLKLILGLSGLSNLWWPVSGKTK